MSIKKNVKESIEDWFVKVVLEHGFASKDYVSEYVGSEIESSMKYSADSDWVEDIEDQACENENNISRLEEKINELEDDMCLESLSDNVDAIFSSLRSLEKYLLEKYPDDQEKILNIFAR